MRLPDSSATRMEPVGVPEAMRLPKEIVGAPAAHGARVGNKKKTSGAGEKMEKEAPNELLSPTHKWVMTAQASKKEKELKNGGEPPIPTGIRSPNWTGLPKGCEQGVATCSSPVKKGFHLAASR